jgi:hypothetical protein
MVGKIVGDCVGDTDGALVGEAVGEFVRCAHAPGIVSSSADFSSGVVV